MTDTQQPPKIKFKKRNIKKKQLRGNNKAVDDSEEGALNTILAVERRRKLLNNRNRGVDSAILLKASKLTTATDNNKTSITTTSAVDSNKDLEERLKGTFSAGKLAGSNDMGGDDENILAKKHQLAMEEFIQSNLQQSGGIGKTTTESSNGEASSSATTIINNAGPITEDEKELFAELLSTSDLNTNNNQANNASQSKLEGDVGAGGAMMMGSGIAEVALPVSERLKTQKATEMAALEYEKAQASRRRAPTVSRHDGGNDDYDDQFPTAGGSTGNDVNVAVVNDLPMNFASGPGKRKRQEDVNVVSTTTTTTTTTSPKKNVAPSQKEQSIVSSSSAAYYSASSAGGSVQRSDVSTLGQSYSHNFQLHQQDWIAQRRDERQSEIDTLKTKQHADEAQDLATTGGKERMGFEMARRAAKGEKNVRPSVPRGPNGESLMNEWDRKKGGTHNQRSNDDRVWKQFMQKNKR